MASRRTGGAGGEWPTTRYRDARVRGHGHGRTAYAGGEQSTVHE